MTVFHGSPHRFDRFSLDKIGTGEGAQAYGHGLYFAEDPAIAGHYQRMQEHHDLLTLRDLQGNLIRQGDSLDDIDLDAIKMLESGRRDAGQFPHNTAYYAKKRADSMAEGLPGAAKRNEAVKSRIDELADAKVSYEKNTGNLYEVDIPDDAISKMLDWDAPLSEQPESVLEAIARARVRAAPWLSLSDEMENMKSWGWQAMTGGDLLRTLHELHGTGNAEQVLKEYGIPGIRYFDGSSRAAGEGTRNVVLFDDSLAQILKRNEEPLNIAPRR
jgi:hypothetical protein